MRTSSEQYTYRFATESRIDHLIPEVRRAAITLGQRIPPA